LYFQADTPNLANANSIQGNRANNVWTQFGQALLNIVGADGGPVTSALSPPAMSKLKLNAQAVGTGS
jgi:hypothetical protein